MNDVISPGGAESAGPTESARVLACLQQAYSALREAVDHQRLPDPTSEPARWAEQIHEIRTIMSAAAQLVRSYDPTVLADSIGWSEAGPPPAAEVTPAELLANAKADLTGVMDHLNHAAADLTAARIKLTHLA